MLSGLDSSFWLQVHLCCSIGADLLLLISGVLALLYLWQDWRLKTKKLGYLFFGLPAIHTLDDWVIRLLTTAFILMTAGTVSGSVMASQLWGKYWYLDARQVWSILVWVLFASILISRFLAGWRGRKASLISVVGIVFMLIGHVSLGAFTQTKHQGSYTGLIGESGFPYDQ